MFYTQSTAKGHIRVKQNVFIQVKIWIHLAIHSPPSRIEEILEKWSWMSWESINLVGRSPVSRHSMQRYTLRFNWKYWKSDHNFCINGHKLKHVSAHPTVWLTKMIFSFWKTHGINKTCHHPGGFVCHKISTDLLDPTLSPSQVTAGNRGRDSISY